MFKSKKRIIARANSCLSGQVDIKALYEVFDYDIDEEWYFWVMYGIGAATMNGFISKPTSNEIRDKMSGIYRRMIVKMYCAKKMHAAQIARAAKYSRATNDIYKALKAHDAEGLGNAVIEALSAMRGEECLLELYRLGKTDPDFKKKWINTLIENEERFDRLFGGDMHPESYVQLIEAFYRGCIDDGSAELFNGFNSEEDSGDADWDKCGDPEDLQRLAANMRKLTGVDKVEPLML